MSEPTENVWNIVGNDQQFEHSCLYINDKSFFTQYHPRYQINVLQWCLWYVGSSTKAFAQEKFESFSRKQWAFNRIKTMYEHLPKDIWRELVHMNTGYSNKCKTIHYFSRNGYSIEPYHLDSINKWFDEVNGRFTYTYSKDEYGYTPGDYVEFHRKRSELFRKKVKDRVDKLVKKYHYLENKLREFLAIKTMKEFYEGLKLVNNIDTFYEQDDVRKQIVDILKVRLESHIIHETLFKDELTLVEKKEELLNRGLSQCSNHLWIINAYRKIISGTIEGILIERIIEAKKITIYKNFS